MTCMCPSGDLYLSHTSHSPYCQGMLTVKLDNGMLLHVLTSLLESVENGY